VADRYVVIAVDRVDRVADAVRAVPRRG